VPGNFGGEIETSAYKDLSRRTFSELIRRQGGTWINCGDGARIDGAQPKAAAALDLPVPPGGRAAVLESLRRRLRAHAAGGYNDRDALRRHVEACDMYRAEHAELVARARREGDGPWEFERRMRAFRNARLGAFDGVDKIAGGSLDSLFRLAVHRAGRIGDAAGRGAFFADFLEAYGQESEEVLGRAQQPLAGFLGPG